MFGNIGSEINFKLQNNIAQLENIRFQINNSNIPSNELFKTGIEIINDGIQILNLCLQLSNIKMEMNLNINLQIQNIGILLQNKGIQLQQYQLIPNMGMQNLNFGMFQPFNPNINLIENNNNGNIIEKVQKINIVFTNKKGEQTTITLPFGTTVENAIKSYYDYNPQLKTKNNVIFIYNAININVNDKTKIEEFFKNQNYVRVLVNYDDLIGGKKINF